jgi:hypothetical protein
MPTMITTIATRIAVHIEIITRTRRQRLINQRINRVDNLCSVHGISMFDRIFSLGDHSFSEQVTHRLMARNQICRTRSLKSGQLVIDHHPALLRRACVVGVPHYHTGTARPP